MRQQEVQRMNEIISSQLEYERSRFFVCGSPVRAYSLKKDGTKYLDEKKRFKVNEFRCMDGSDTIFISEKLIRILSDVREHFNAPCIISSAYRNDAYNAKVKGATYSMHKYGRAADIKVSGVSPIAVYQYLDGRYPNSLGLGLYGTFTHVDDRDNKARWKD